MDLFSRVKQPIWEKKKSKLLEYNSNRDRLYGKQRIESANIFLKATGNDWRDMSPLSRMHFNITKSHKAKTSVNHSV